VAAAHGLKILGEGPEFNGEGPPSMGQAPVNEKNNLGAPSCSKLATQTGFEDGGHEPESIDEWGSGQ